MLVGDVSTSVVIPSSVVAAETPSIDTASVVPPVSTLGYESPDASGTLELAVVSNRRKK